MVKRLLVTGGCGYFGSNFIKYWKRQHPNDYIRNIDALTYAGKLDNLAPDYYQGAGIGCNHWYWFSNHLNAVCTFEGRIEERQPLKDILEFNDHAVIINFAAETHVDNSLKDSYPFITSNVGGTHNLLELARQYCPETPIIHISTDEVLDHHYPIKQTEDGVLGPKNPYSASKAAAEMLCQAYRANFSMDITVVRPTNLFGPSNQNKEKFLPKAITNLLSGKKVPLYGEGAEMRNWLFMEDACRALELLINLPVRQHVYHVAPDNEISNKELLKKVLSVLDISWEDGVELVENRLGHDSWYGMSSARIRSLGWAPTPLDIGLKSTIDYYKNLI